MAARRWVVNEQPSTNDEQTVERAFWAAVSAAGGRPGNGATGRQGFLGAA